MKVALVTGLPVQDGTYLARHLIDEGYRVVRVVDPLRDPQISGAWTILVHYRTVSL